MHGSSYCRDLFVVKYSAAPGAQADLKPHTDGSIISFNVLLNDSAEFDGGGTHFLHLDATISAERGGCVVHDSKYTHAGQPITRGVRYLLVGFVETTDRMHDAPRNAERTGAEQPQPRMELGSLPVDS